MKIEFKLIKISGVVTGVGFSVKTNNGTYSEKICETLFDTGDDKKDADDSKKWATLICNLLNQQPQT
jgi:hypothetical protein